MTDLRLTRQEFLWEFPYCEILLLWQRKRQMNGDNVDWTIVDETLRMMEIFDQLALGQEKKEK